MYAIVEDGGKQYKVTNGDILLLDRELKSVKAEDTTITLDRVLLVGGAGDAKIGTPTVAGASVTAEVLEATRGPKIDIQKYKRRKGYHKRQGHRQNYLKVRVSAINV